MSLSIYARYVPSALAALAFIWLCLFAHIRPLATPDEARYVEIPREMVVTGDWTTPRLNAVKYFEKPPLLYWMEASVYKLAGLHEGLLRFVPIFFAWLGLIGTAWCASHFFGRLSGIFAGGILALTPLYYALSNLIITDMPFSALLACGLFCFLRGVETPHLRRKRLFYAGFTLLLGLATLTKGIAALAIPGPLIVMWATIYRRWGRIFPAFIPSNIILFLAIVAPWHLLVSLENPEFAYKYFIVEHFLRYTTDVHLRTQPFWFFIPIILAGAFPWILFSFSKIRERLKDPTEGFLYIWAFWVVGFFSISNSKLIPYVLPALPPIAVLAGNRLTILWEENRDTFFPRLISWGNMILGMGILGYAFIKGNTLPNPSVRAFLFLIALILLVFGSSYIFKRNRSFRFKIGALSATWVLVLMALGYYGEVLQKPSILPIVGEIKKNLKPEDMVVSFKTYLQDLPVYLNRTIGVVDYLGEMEFGTTIESTSAWMFKEEQLLLLWDKQKLWIVGKKGEIEDFKKRHPEKVTYPLDVKAPDYYPFAAISNMP